MLRKFALLLMMLFLASTISFAQTTIITADRMLDVESGDIISPAVIVIQDGKILAINPKSAPEGELIELGNVTLMPGLMDMHTHLTGEISPGWQHRGIQELVGDEALRGARNAMTTLKAGFTTVRNVGSGGFAGVSLARSINLGITVGPDVYPAGHALGITGGHCDVTGYAPGILELGPKQGVANGVDEVLLATRYQIKHGAKVIKICATAGVLSFDATVGAQQYSFEEMETIVQEAARHGIKVAAHAHGSAGILAAVKAGVASIEHGSILTDEIIDEMKQRGTFLVPTTYLTEAIDLDQLPPPIRAKAEYILPIAQASTAKAIAAGVRIAFGTDAAVYPHGDNAKEFVSLQKRGMSAIEAIRSATLNAAELLDLTDRGSLKTGLRADIIAVPGNPLEDLSVIQSVSFVMKAGAIIH